MTGIDSGSNNAPVANNDTGAVNEDATLTVDAASGVESNDTDPDGDDIEVHAIQGGSVGSGVTGTYGTLTLNANGSYTYIACLLYTSPSPRDMRRSRMPSSA